MNISTIDLAPPESKTRPPKTDTEETDLFSTLMASIAAGGGIQQGNNNLTAGGGEPTLTGQVTFSTIDVPTDQDSGLVSPTSLPVDSSTGKGLTAQETDSVFTLERFVEGEDPKGPSEGVPYLTPEKTANAETGDGIETREANIKPSLIVSDNDKDFTGKDLDVGDGIMTTFGRESINSGLLHSPSTTLAESDPALRNIHRPQIDPVDLVAQVSGKIKADFNSEGSEVRMELHPESLGHLKIEIRVEGGVVRANILTENAMVKDTIDTNLSLLRSSLEEHGLRIDQLSVGIDQRHGGSGFAERNDLQRWLDLEGVDAPRYEEPVNESWYHADTWQEKGVSIFA